jgi:hypothetical protein
MRSSCPERAGRAAAVAALAAAAAIAPAVAGAWTQEEGATYYRFGLRGLQADRFYDPGGNRVAIPTLTDVAWSVYGEHGLTGRLTFLAYAPIVERIALNEVVEQPGNMVLAEGDSTSGPADWNAGVRFLLARGRRAVLSAGLVVGLPVGEDDQESGLLTGDGEFNQIASLQAGRSFGAGAFYVTGEIGFNNRNRGYSDEVRYEAEAGWTLARKRLTLLVKWRRVESLENGDDAVTGGTSGLHANNQEYTVIAPEAFWRIGDSWGLAFGYERLLDGRNVLDAPAYSIGLVFKR